MHKIASCLPEADHYYTPYYCDAALDWFRRKGYLESTIVGNKLSRRCMEYLAYNNLPIDLHGTGHRYDLVLTCADLIIPQNIRSTPIVLVQEGMTDPEGFLYRVVKTFPSLPRWIASTSAMGLSHIYQKFCVASEGYRELFIRKGIDPKKIEVTGIPNFDNCAQYQKNNFPYKHYVLVCTSDVRETFGFENRKRTILQASKIANGRLLIFKLHPNEYHERSIYEIKKHAPEALIYTSGSAEEMIANCDVLITRYSSTAYIGIALGKEVYSNFDLKELQKLLPLQHGQAAKKIANVCRQTLNLKPVQFETQRMSVAV